MRPSLKSYRQITGAALLLTLGNTVQAAGIAWHHHWTPMLFAQARAEHRYVLLDLHAVWCHWCHVMDDVTYSDPQVQKLIAGHYVAASIDADADPALAARYGDWGWPATIVLAADGSEIAKLRGYRPPASMIGLLRAVVADPSPGPSVQAPPDIVESAAGALSATQRKTLNDDFDRGYDVKYGGWGNLDKYLDADATELLLERARHGDAQAARRARRTLDQNLKLIDPVWGGVDQYADQIDWSGPHYEKLMVYQAGDMALYAEAWALWKDPRYLRAAQALHGYIEHFLTAPSGAFYTSQDADLSTVMPGAKYYALDDAQRRRLGIPRIDKHRYARENGWAIAALCTLYDVTGDAIALDEAKRAAHWVLRHRALPDGGFRHGVAEDAPELGDTLAMARAFVDLHRSTGTIDWLVHAQNALDYIDARFRDRRGGYFTSPAPHAAKGVFATPVRSTDDNVALARTANLIAQYTGRAADHTIATRAMRYLAAPALVDSGRFLPGLLLADRELSHEPLHITVVGGKDDPRARALHAAALRYPSQYRRVDWWDRREGPLPNADVQYPELPRAAAFVCTAHACSSPVFDPARLAGVAEALRKSAVRPSRSAAAS